MSPQDTASSAPSQSATTKTLSSSPKQVKQDGLEWVKGMFSLRPCWTREPNMDVIETLARRHLNIKQGTTCKVTFHAQGAFNKLYKIEAAFTKTSLMRVTLPVDPYVKTSSEVATIDFVRQHTNIPVAEIYAYDASADNELGFEWILMEMLPGAPLRRKWRQMPRDIKKQLVESIANYQNQLFQHKFVGIGNIFNAADTTLLPTTGSDDPKLPVKIGQVFSMIFSCGAHWFQQKFGRIANMFRATKNRSPTAINHRSKSAVTIGQMISATISWGAHLFQHPFDRIRNIFKAAEDQSPAVGNPRSQPVATIGPIVSMIFFWGDRLQRDVSHGPFTASHDWLHAQLSLILHNQKRIIQNSDDPDAVEDAEDARDLADRLLKLLPQFFPRETVPEPTVLFHDDLNMGNMLVDDDGRITGVIDWEFVSALPLWRTCEIPHFLCGQERTKEPHRENYAKYDGEDKEHSPDEDLDNEGMDSLFWQHMLEYEQTILRREFLSRMGEMESGWIDEREKGSLKADFRHAVHCCDSPLQTRKIRGWLDKIENGEVPEESLRSRGKAAE